MLSKNQKSSFIRFALILVLFSGMLGVMTSKDALAAAGDTVLVSRAINPSRVMPKAASTQASITADGRYVAFMSGADNLVSYDDNYVSDIFVYDRQMDQMERISVASDGSEANNGSSNPSISADGRFVAFDSEASNLVDNDTNGVSDVFVHDRQTHVTRRVMSGSDPVISANGQFIAFTNLAYILVYDCQTDVTTRVPLIYGRVEDRSYSPAISADGRYVAFGSNSAYLVSGDTNSVDDIFVYDRQTNTMTRVSIAGNGVEANSDSLTPSISGDGRYVSFVSNASNLVSNDINGVSDIFVHDRQTGQTELVSLTSDGTSADNSSVDSSISADGQSVAFSSMATNLVNDDTNGISDIFVFDRQTGLTERISVDSSGVQANYHSTFPFISADGRYVAFESLAWNLVTGGDYNEMADIYVRDRQNSETGRISVGMISITAGASSASLSANGRYVAFTGDASKLVNDDPNGYFDILIYDTQSGTLERLNIGAVNNHLYEPHLSADGRYVAFRSQATNLVSGDTNGESDVFVYDREAGQIERVSVASDGTQANRYSQYVSISADGRYVVFQSAATNLVSNDTNNYPDIFVHDRETGLTEPVSLASDGTQARGDSYKPSISANGRYVAFYSYAPNLVNGDTNLKIDIFVHDRETGVTERVSQASDGSQANDTSYDPAISADGRYVVFSSRSTNLVSGDTNNSEDIFVYDRETDKIERVSVMTNGEQGYDFSTCPAISANGRYVVFCSSAILVTGDTNHSTDIFIHDRVTGTTQRVSLGSNGRQTNDASLYPTISADGRYVTFSSIASNLVEGDGNEAYDLFIHENDIPPTILSIVRDSADNTSAVSVDFRISFSEPVQDVEASDFILNVTEMINGAMIENVTPAASCGAYCDTYTVRVNTGSGNGTIRLEVPANATIQDQAGNLLDGLPFLTGEMYTVKKLANVNVYINGELRGNHFVAFHESTRLSYKNVNSGAIKIESMNSIPLIGSERVIYKAAGGTNTSFSEMMALPNSQLDNIYWLPWYNNVDLDTQLRFGNVSGSTAYVHVIIGTTEMAGSPFILQPGETTRQSFSGVNNGPVRINSDHGVPIVAAERVIYKAAGGTQTSFSEMMALPNSQLNTTYWLPWYNNVDLDTQLRFGNVSSSPATVHVYIGTDEIAGSPFILQPGESTRQSFAGINNGPVKIQSDVNIVAAERVIYKAAGGTQTSFTEMMALPDSQLNSTYWLPWYNNVDLDTQLRFGNVSGNPATVHVYIGGAEVAGSPFTLQPGESTRQSFAGVNNGPVKIQSDVNIVAAERVIYKVKNINTSFSEMMALPNSQLDTTYWLPWYNNIDLDTQLRFGVP